MSRTHGRVCEQNFADFKQKYQICTCNWKIHVFQSIFLFVGNFLYFWGALLVFLAQFITQNCCNWHFDRARTTIFRMSVYYLFTLYDLFTLFWCYMVYKINKLYSLYIIYKLHTLYLLYMLHSIFMAYLLHFLYSFYVLFSILMQLLLYMLYLLHMLRAIPCQRSEKKGQRRKMDFFLWNLKDNKANLWFWPFFEQLL